MPTETKDRSRIDELKSALRQKADEIEGMSQEWKMEDGGKLVISPDQHKRYLQTVNEAEEIKGLLAAEEKAHGIHEYLSAPDGEPYAGRDASEAQRGRFAAKTLGGAFLDSDVYAEMKQSGFRRLGETFTMEGQSLHDLATKDVYSQMAGDVSLQALGRSEQLPLQERQRRPNRVRDLFPVQRTNAAVLYGIRETGFTNAAAPVPERVTGPPAGWGQKPRSNISLTTVTYPVATIAHLIDAHRNVLDDEPRLRSILDTDMIDGVKMSEDFQILYGDGVGENITGVVNTPGIQTYTQVAPDKKSAAIRRAATRAMLSYYQPQGVVAHPLDWEDIELEVDNNGAYTVAVSVAVGGEKRVWRMQVVDTPAINEGQFLVGSFGQGAKLYDREQVNVQVSTENAANFEMNVVTIRAEERVALEVPRPESFVLGTFL